jgi:hypothetical protein
VTDVFAPGDVTIYYITQTQTFGSNGNLLDEDYSVYFSPCKQIRAWYGHMIISDRLKAEVAKTECQEMGASPPGYKQCQYLLNYKVKAGDYMGTAGGGTSASLDLGVYDSRTPISGFVAPGRYRSDYLETNCPVDYFTEPLKSTMYGLLGWFNGKRTVEPICGSVMQDVPGTAQGNWFDGPLSNLNLENEGKAISLVHDYHFGVLGELVIGGQVSQPGIIEFTTTHTGTTDREPSEVRADGKIYCYQNDNVQETYMGLSGKFILQLVDANTLKIEHQDGSCSGTESFASPYTYKR